MSNLIKISFLANTVRTDGMVNATALTTAYRNTTGVRKDVANWLATQEARDSTAYLERATGIHVADLVIVENGVGTWVHPDLAEILAQWISVEYRFAVVALIRQTKADSVPSTVNLAEWHKERIAGIVERRSLTDMVKLLIQYAEAAGSTNAHYYFTHFSNLVNKHIILDGAKTPMSKIKDKRDRMDKDQLRNVATFETMFVKLIGDGMAKGDKYQTIYEDCKVRASAIAAVLDIEPMPLLAKSNRKLIEAKLDKSLLEAT
jgi:KilA-N domain